MTLDLKAELRESFERRGWTAPKRPYRYEGKRYRLPKPEDVDAPYRRAKSPRTAKRTGVLCARCGRQMITKRLDIEPVCTECRMDGGLSKVDDRGGA